MQSANAETIIQFDSRMATPCNYYALGLLLNSSDEALCVVTGLITAEQSSENI